MMNDTTAHLIPGMSLIGRFGLKANPIGAHATYRLSGRDYLVDVKSVYRNDVTGMWMLTVRHFNGEAAADVALSFVSLLSREN